MPTAGASWIQVCTGSYTSPNNGWRVDFHIDEMRNMCSLAWYEVWLVCWSVEVVDWLLRSLKICQCSVFSVSCVRETAAPGLALPASSDQAAPE